LTIDEKSSTIRTSSVKFTASEKEKKENFFLEAGVRGRLRWDSFAQTSRQRENNILFVQIIPFLKNNDFLGGAQRVRRSASRSASTKIPLLSLASYSGNGITYKSLTS